MKNSAAVIAPKTTAPKIPAGYEFFPDTRALAQRCGLSRNEIQRAIIGGTLNPQNLPCGMLVSTDTLNALRAKSAQMSALFRVQLGAWEMRPFGFVGA